MKKTLLSLIILFVANSAIGQNYQCLQRGVKHFFINSNNYLRGIRIDSTRSYADSIVFFPFHTPRGPYSSTSLPVLDPNGGSWLGKKVVQHNDGTTIFDNYWNDSVVIRTQANVGESWTFYNDTTSIYYVATVVAKDTMTVLSTLDSIKRIQINSFDASGALPSDTLNNLMLILSKDHGFVQAFDLYTFPYHKPDSTYRQELDYFLDMSLRSYNSILSFAKSNIEFKLVDFINPNDWQLNPWNIGDRFNSSNYCSVIPSTYCGKHFTSEVVSKSTSGHIVTYTLSGTTSAPCSSSCFAPVHINDAGAYSFNDTLYSIIDPTQMPEDHFTDGHYYYYFPDDTSYCRKSPLYIKRPFNNILSGLGSSVTRVIYKAEIGLVNYYHIDGNPWEHGASLTYYNINGASCGTPLSINEKVSEAASTKIAPNPATTSLIVNTTQPENTIIIKNPVGQTIKRISTNRSETTVDVTDIPAGIYFISVIDASGNGSTTRELILH